MRIPRQFSVLALGFLVLAGCRETPRQDTVRMSEAMPNLPLPPLATVVSRSGGPDALSITFRSSVSPDSMVSFYRQTLSRGEWNLVSDNKSREGVYSLYAERQGPPLWVTIQKDTAGPGTLMTLAGATPPDTSKVAVDTTKKTP